MTMTRLCLNMIVRNESDRIERCLASVKDWIWCYAILDTGSTDDTVNRIRDCLGSYGKIRKGEFVDFATSRNAAIDLARNMPAPMREWDYLLLIDADMELRIDDPGCFGDHLTAPAYSMMQRDEAISYRNVRLLRHDVAAQYIGATHEYLSISGLYGNEPYSDLDGAWFFDHADGANRPGKFERDLALLEGKSDARSVFYRAQTLRDLGRTEEAAKAYRQRSDMGGWEEEAWYAALQESRLIDDTQLALTAYNRRPHRVEPLYDLAYRFRQEGKYELAAMFASWGIVRSYPKDDRLFIEDWIYRWGLQQELAITGYYSDRPHVKRVAGEACNALALDRGVPDEVRNLARENEYWYLSAAAELMPSFATRRVDFKPPVGWRAMNPSVTVHDGEIWVSQRCVNYELVDGEYRTPPDEPITSRNFMLRLHSGTLLMMSEEEIGEPAGLPQKYDLVLGFEDPRLFTFDGKMYRIATVRQCHPGGLCQQVVEEIRGDYFGFIPTARHEKNWMPIEGSGKFIYSCDPTRIIAMDGEQVAEWHPSIAARHFKGGSQAICFGRGWLAIVHSVIQRSSTERCYTHRFVWFDDKYNMRRYSHPFYLNKKGIEFVAGLAYHPAGDKLLISYGVDDRESWIATVNPEEVSKLMEYLT